MSFLKYQNVRTGIVFIALAVVVLAGLSGLKEQTRELPQLMAYAIALLGVLLIVQTVVRKRRAGAGGISPGSSPGAETGYNSADIVVAFAALLLMYGLLFLIGFYFSVALFVIFIFNYYTKRWTAGEIAKSVGFGILLIGFLYVVFAMVMRLSTPSGILL